MKTKEAIKKLQSALKQIDEAQPLCPSPGCDILSNAGMNVDLALEILKEQPPSSEFTKNLKELMRTHHLLLPLLSEELCVGVEEACDRLDASEASRKELLEALEHIRIIPRNFKSGMTYEKRMVRMIEIAEAAIKKAEK